MKGALLLSSMQSPHSSTFLIVSFGTWRFLADLGEGSSLFWERSSSELKSINLESEKKCFSVLFWTFEVSHWLYSVFTNMFLEPAIFLVSQDSLSISVFVFYWYFLTEIFTSSLKIRVIETKNRGMFLVELLSICFS